MMQVKKEKKNRVPKKISFPWHKKLITMLCFCFVLNNTSVQVLASDESVVESVEESLEDIITRYHLENQRSYIEANLSAFLEYYQTVKSNSNLSINDIEMSLQSFYHVHKYLGYDFDTQLRKLSYRTVSTDDAFCNQNFATGLFVKGTNDIYVISNVDNLTKIHENIHHHWDFSDVLYLKNGSISSEKDYTDIILGSSLTEALASDLACMEYSLTGFTEVYPELNLSLQGLYAIFGREQTLQMLSHPNYLETIYETFLSIGLSTKQIISFFEHLDALHGISTNRNPSDVNLEQLYFQISQDLITIYEAKSKQSWKDNQKMMTIVYAFNQQSNFSFSVSESMQENYDDIQKLVQSADFLGENIDFKNSFIRVTIESDNPNFSGDLCILEQRKILTHQEIDTLKYAFHQGVLSKKEGYNSFEEKQNELLLFYGISKTDWHYYIDNSSFFVAYEYGIQSIEYLNAEEKREFITKMPSFILLHSKLFQRKNNAVAQSLFISSLKHCFSKEELLQLFQQEELLYQKGGKIYLESLEEAGFIDYDCQKEILTNFDIYDMFSEILTTKLMSQTITESEYRELLLEFPTFLEHYPELLEMESYDLYDFMERIFEPSESMVDMYSIIHKSNNQKRKLVFES